MKKRCLLLVLLALSLAGCCWCGPWGPNGGPGGGHGGGPGFSRPGP